MRTFAASIISISFIWSIVSFGGDHTAIFDDPTPTPTPTPTPPSANPIINMGIYNSGGPLPWSAPSLPVIPTQPAPEIDIDSMSHSDAYATQTTDTNTNIDAMATAAASLAGAGDTWSDDLPETGGADSFDTGLDPLDSGSNLTTGALAVEIGSNLAAPFVWARGVYATADQMGLGTFAAAIGFAIVFVAVSALIMAFSFMIRLAGGLFDLIDGIINAIGEIIPL
jgi:hypothetical protein